MHAVNDDTALYVPQRIHFPLSLMKMEFFCCNTCIFKYDLSITILLSTGNTASSLPLLLAL
jgi:hypothetical protein